MAHKHSVWVFRVLRQIPQKNTKPLEFIEIMGNKHHIPFVNNHLPFLTITWGGDVCFLFCFYVQLASI